MMYELKLAEHSASKKNNIKLHPKIMEILFENSRYIKNVFSNLKGMHGITHMSMICINPICELLAFSTTPNIEYNLFHQHLWIEDHCFNLNIEDKNTLSKWEYQNDQIERVKLKNNHFTMGMSIYRPIGDYDFIYSFATNEKVKGLDKYYNEHLFDLIDMGDYFYKSLRDLYSYYSPNHSLPDLKEFNSKAIGLNVKPFLRLVQR
ncbi:MAG: hypothetical protein QG594_1606 [Bacteroidota bacterium]|nr:hypothetical protein [Pseudomonadota bacterium]MDQ5929825.1 hypothetical protein [Bacteroidota bacterium]